LSFAWTFITAIPDLIKLLMALQTAIEKAEVDRKVNSDLKALREAINAKDPTAVAHIFNS
jgi:hypothetical protein